MNLTSIPAFTDNYIWTLSDLEGRCLIIDPGEAAPVLETLAANQWQPAAILLTHHHHDHVGGVDALRQQFPALDVYGPPETADKGATIIVNPGDNITLLGTTFQIIATPGHTLGHVAYYSNPYLFCGDTLFSGGCGRLFEGTAEQMFNAFQEINLLPAETLICCGHEYTLSNMKFANAILPEDKAISAYYHEIKQLRAKQQVSLPSTLEKERKINLFLRTHDHELQRKLGFNSPPDALWEIFSALRRKKDEF
ncbi:hydroxyacylglutathione hydrolase [Enterobacterales bacterium CwR94]|nr:hydroxyacylglutathione hydrolase [Enterobacterales bacterium CwR94]